MYFHLCVCPKIPTGKLILKDKTLIMPDTCSPTINTSNQAVNIKNYRAAPLADTLRTGYFTVDATWVVLNWNRAAEIMLKVAAKDIVGQDLWSKFSGIIPTELLSIHQRGFQKDVHVHFQEYWGELGGWFDVITYHCDNTFSVSFKSNRAQAELPEGPVQRLKVLTELYRFVTEITNDCLWEWNLLAKNIFWIDGGHKRVFGYQVENALVPQIFWESLIHPDDKEHVLEALRQIMATGTSSHWEVEYRFKTNDGNYLHVHDRGHIIYNEDGKISRIIGATNDVSEKILLEKKLGRERLAKQREITDAVLRSQEKEREIIATELNENLNQLLVTAKWNIQLAQSDSAKADICLDNAVEYLNKVIGEIKRIYKTLVIPDKAIFGLFGNVKKLIEDLGKNYPVIFKFNEGGIDEEEDLPENMQHDIFRIIQEQLNNIIKHAHAENACIDLKKLQNKIILTISDDGIGSKPGTEKKTVGLINIRSRVELYDGTLTIASKTGEGYNLKVVLPCSPVQYSHN